MTRRRAKYVFTCSLLVVAETACGIGYAKPQEQHPDETPPMFTADKGDKNPVNDVAIKRNDDAYEPAIGNSNSVGVPFLKNLASDQKSIWTSPIRLRWADGTWLFPLAAVAG